MSRNGSSRDKTKKPSARTSRPSTSGSGWSQKSAAPARNFQPDPPRDPYGLYERRLAVLAKEFDYYLPDLVDEWDHRAAIRQYDGEVSREDANELAMADVEAWLKQRRPQRALFEEAA